MALSGVFDTIQAQWAYLAITLQRDETTAPWRDQYRLLESYYLQNGAYEVLAKLFTGSAIAPKDMRTLRNPCFRVVEFYAAKVWPGMLPDALPIETENEAIIEPIEQIWQWSNWSAQKQTCVRWFATFGDMFLKVATNGRMADEADPQDQGQEVTRVIIENIKPEFVTDFSVDERGYLTYIRLDQPITEGTGMNQKSLVHTEVWDKETQTFRVWKHDKKLGEELEKLPPPVRTERFAAFGIDFVPFVWMPFRSAGLERGIGAFTLQLEKIDEANRQATRLHQILFRYNKALWALKANAMDASGRPLPPPRMGAGGDETLEISEVDDTVIKLPGMSELQSLIPQIAYADALEILNAQLREIKEDLPELAYYAIREMGEPSGVAVRLLLSDAIDRLIEARGNAETALVRAQQMALTLGAQAGLEGFTGIGTFEEGDFEHKFAERDVFPPGTLEQAEIAQGFVKAGFPLMTAARMAGLSEQELATLERDMAAEETRSQAQVDNALALTQARIEQQNNVPVSQNGTEPETETA